MKRLRRSIARETNEALVEEHFGLFKYRYICAHALCRTEKEKEKNKEKEKSTKRSARGSLTEKLWSLCERKTDSFFLRFVVACLIDLFQTASETVLWVGVKRRGEFHGQTDDELRNSERQHHKIKAGWY